MIISYPDDAHAQAVIKSLRAHDQEPLLLNLSRFPTLSKIQLHYGGENRMLFEDSLRDPVDLHTCRSVWWRRPQPFGIPAEVRNPVHRAFAMGEAQEVFGGVWGLLKARWVNDPYRDDLAHRKTFQLRVAREAGLSIPDTLVTNDPEAASDFIKRQGSSNTVYKAFSGTPVAWRETRLVGAEEIEKLDLVRIAPVLFQRYVEGADIRVTVVGDQIFPAAIDTSRGDYPVDFRMNYDVIKIEPTELPECIRNGILNLMSCLGLVYGAIDFKRTEDDRYVFLEINPAGQWLFVEHHTQQPITEALAEKLIEFDSY
jgi:hypothetical protein